MKKSFKVSEDKHCEDLKSVTLERDEATLKLRGVEVELAKVQSESLKSFEE